MRPRAFALAMTLCLTGHALADEAAIKKNLAARLPNLPQIDEVSKSPVNGLWEVRLGSQIVYSDDQGSFVIEGEIIDTQKHLNLTEARVAKLTEFNYASLPLKDAVVWKRGTGARKMVVFADPNCAYCKRLEHDLNDVKDVTVYTFLYPILGGDSPEKSKAIWCAKNNGQVWRSWMLDAVAPPATAATAKCDTSALDRNIALAKKHGVVGTPNIVFEDSDRSTGIMSSEELEKKFSDIAGKKTGKS
jgi:thiol:disulfide interchange protein DsbC